MSKRFRFVLRNLMYLRNFQGVIQTLAERGHKILITTSPHDLKVPAELRELAGASRHLIGGSAFGLTHEREDWWAPASRFIRNVGNLLALPPASIQGLPGAYGACRTTGRGRAQPFVFPRVLVPAPLWPVGSAGFVRFLDAGLPPDKAIVEELKTRGLDALI